MFLLNLLLLRYRKLEPTPLTKRKKMIRESNLYDIIKRKERPRDDEIKEESVITPKKKIKSKNIISAREVERRLTPEELEEKRKTESEVGVVRKEFMCVVHKGEIDGPIYLCPYCHTLYCQKCATVLKEKGENCWSCESEINI